MPQRLRVFFWSPGILWHMRRALALVLIAPLLAGCGNPIDGEQLRLCREVIPALNPDGTEIRELRYGPAALGRQGVRIDYVARARGEASSVRYLA
jgi:branched-chain amino acid transport system permease protein